MQGIQCNVYFIRYRESIDDDYVKVCPENLVISHVTKGLPDCNYKTDCKMASRVLKHTRTA